MRFGQARVLQQQALVFLWRERTPVLLWRFDILYMCFAIFMAAMIVRMACRLLTLLTQSTPRET